MADINVQTFSSIGATPVLIYSGRGRLSLAGNARISGASGSPFWTLTATPLQLDLAADTDIYATGGGSASVSLIVTPF
jgi:hypothetical protein